MTLADELESWAMGVELSGCQDYDHVVRRAVEALRAADRVRRLAEVVLAGGEPTAFQVGKRAMAREVVFRMDERPSAAERSGDGC